MMWRNKIIDWLTLSKEPRLVVGERSARWIASFREDLRRWGFPVLIDIENPVVVRGKVNVVLVREDALR